MQIGMTDAAKKDFELNISRPRIAALERRVGGAVALRAVPGLAIWAGDVG